MTNEQLIALAEKCGAHYYRGGAYPGGILFYPGSHLKTFAAALAAAPATKADSTEALRAALQAYVRFDETCGNLKDKLYVQAQKALAATPEAPSHSAPSKPTDEQIAALKSKYGITSDGRGIKEFANVVSFARAVLALRAALPEAQAKPASATAEPSYEQIDEVIQTIATYDIAGWKLWGSRQIHQFARAVLAIPGEPAQAAEPIKRYPTDADIEAGWPFRNAPTAQAAEPRQTGGHADTEGEWLTQSAHLNCPHCGGSGHIDDLGTAEPRQAPSDALDAARYRLIVEDACSNSGEFVTVQPSGYNGGDHVWIEFGFKHPKWTGFDKSHIDAAVDAAIAAQEQKEPKS